MELLDEDTVGEEDDVYSPIDRLKVTDRCDQCGAQAFYWVIMPNSEHGLMFCIHHFRRNEQELRKVCIDVVDESYKINVKPSQSSPD